MSSAAESTTGLWWRDRWADAVWESTLTSSQKLVALAYADHAKSGRTAYVTQDRLVERTGLSRPTVNAALRELERGGWLTGPEERPKRRTVTYSLTLPRSQVSELPDPEPVVKSAAPVVKNPAPVVKSLNSTSGITSRRTSSSSPTSTETHRSVAARITGLDEEEEIFDFIEELLREQEVRAPSRWLQALTAEDLLGHLHRLKAAADEKAEVARRRAELEAARAAEEEALRCPECRIVIRFGFAHAPGCPVGIEAEETRNRIRAEAEATARAAREKADAERRERLDRARAAWERDDLTDWGAAATFQTSTGTATATGSVLQLGDTARVALTDTQEPLCRTCRAFPSVHGQTLCLDCIEDAREEIS